MDSRPAMCDAEWAELDNLRDELRIAAGINAQMISERDTARDRIRELEAENDRLRVILDGCDDAAIERAARALCPIPWNDSDEPTTTTYRTLALTALRAAGSPHSEDACERCGGGVVDPSRHGEGFCVAIDETRATGEADG